MDMGQLIICMVLVFSLGGKKSVEAQNSQNNIECTTPNNLDGNCISIKTCPTLFSLLSYQSQNSTIATLLRNSHCGYESNFPYYPKVCCPLETPTDYIDDLATITPIPSSYNICGQSHASHSRIAGGSPAELGAWPWMAAIGFRNRSSKNSKITWWCGGSLITYIYVLTAAHCTESYGNLSLSVVRLGDLNLDPNVDDKANPIDIEVSRVIRHRKYSPHEFSNYDIALLKLKKTVTFNQFIRPICLPNSPELRNRTFDKLEPYVAGWGATISDLRSNALLEVQVPVIDNTKCKQLYNNITINDRHLCAGKLGKDACNADSGGPLMFPHGGQYYLIGVVSFGPINCGKTDHPGVYARVTSFVDWIEDNMKYT